MPTAYYYFIEYILSFPLTYRPLYTHPAGPEGPAGWIVGVTAAPGMRGWPVGRGQLSRVAMWRRQGQRFRMLSFCRSESCCQ